jgi:hypothetical protein
LPIITIVAVNARFPILTTRNFLIVTPAIAILIGHGLTNLDHTAKRLAAAVFVLVSLFTLDAYHLKPPIRQLSQDVLRYWEGDELILMDIWVDDFALRYHIGRDLGRDPEALPLVSLPTWREQYGEAFFARLLDAVRDESSLWLVYWGQNQDGLLDFFPTHGFTRTATQVEFHRDERLYVYRYERTPAQPLATFGETFTLLRAEASLLPPELPEPGAGATTGATVRVNLLWRAAQAPPVDYSVSVFMLDADGKLIAQHDSPPLDGRDPTSGWQVGDVRFDSHRLRVPGGLPTPAPTIGVKVYWYADPKPLPVIATARGGAAAADYYALSTQSLP